MTKNVLVVIQTAILIPVLDPQFTADASVFVS